MSQPTSNITNQYLIEFAAQLQAEGWESGKNKIYSASLSAKIALLEEFAAQYNAVFSLFDFEEIKYLFHTQNLLTFIGVSPSENNNAFDFSYTQIVQDKKAIENFLIVRSKLIEKYPDIIFNNFQSVACGGSAIDLKGNPIRMLYKAKPLTFKNGEVKISFDSIANVIELINPEPGYWIRFSFSDRVAYWFSEKNEIIERDIISPREKELIQLWKKGLSIPQIAAQFSSGKSKNLDRRKPTGKFFKEALSV